MNKNIMLVVGAVVLVIVAGGLFFNNQQSENIDEAMEQKNVMKEKTDDSVMTDKSAGSRYVLYSKTTYDTAVEKRRVLYFYATWCPSCKQANEDFTANPNKIPEDVIVLRVNYNDPDTDQEEKKLAKKYGITYQHTFVQVDSAGKELTKWNGGDTDDLLTNIK